MNNENQTVGTNGVVNGVLQIFKDTPSLLVIILIVYIFTTLIGEKLDTINSTLTENSAINRILIERMEDEAEDTKLFIEQQTEIIHKLDILLNMEK